MKAIADMSDTELMDRVFDLAGMFVGPDGTGLAYTAILRKRVVVGPSGSKQLTRYYALRYLASRVPPETTRP